LPFRQEAFLAAAPHLDQVGLGAGHGGLGPGLEVAQRQVEEVVVKGEDAAVFHFFVDGGEVVVGQLGRHPDHAVAPVVIFQNQRHALVAQENDVHLVFFGVGGDVLGVDADRVAGDEALEPVLGVEHVLASEDLVADDEQFLFGPVAVEFVFEGILADDAEVGAVDASISLEEAAFAGALGALHDNG